ncbi:MAG TPA: alkaline phosphatase family protein [Nitrolancea sp.]
MVHHNTGHWTYRRRRLPGAVVALLVTLLILAGCGTRAATSPPPATNTAPATVAPSATATAVATVAPSTTSIVPAAATATRVATTKRPLFDHIYLIVMENKESTSIIGSSNAPYINSLFSQYGVAKDYTGVAHPSQPNYLALWAGSTFGVTDDNVHNLTGETLADQIEAANMTWKVYEENYPVGDPNGAPRCYTDSSANGGPDGSGSYARKHDPAISFTNVNGDTARCSQHITNFSHFDAAAANFSFIVPNLCHDMHDCSVKQGDTWLQQWLPTHILNTSTWKNSNSALFITWDEGTSANGGGGTVPLIVISHKTPAGYVSNTPYNHYALLRTIENAWGFACLRDACQSPDLSEFFP